MKRASDSSEPAAKKPAVAAEDPMDVRRQLFAAGSLVSEASPGKWVIEGPGAGDFASSQPIELTYFAIRSLGQLPQLCLEVAGYPYRYTVVLSGYFAKHLKENLAFGRLPCVRTPGGQEIVQSKAVLRYVAKRCGLAGANDIDVARCDMLHEMLQSEGKLDVAEIKKLHGGSGKLDAAGDVKSISRRDALQLSEEQKTLAALKFWESTVARSSSGWLLGGVDDGEDFLSYVDLALYWSLRPHVPILTELGCTKLVEFVAKVHALPGIRRLIESGRMMPDVDPPNYVYKDDDLVKKP